MLTLKKKVIIIIIIIIIIMTASVVQWSEFLATDPEARVQFPALPEKKK
jgi:hypothetical protein